MQAIIINGATRVLAHRRATKEVKERIRAHGLKLQDFSGRQLREWVALYVEDHRWELMKWASGIVAEWERERRAKLKTNAQRKATCSKRQFSVQMLGAE